MKSLGVTDKQIGYLISLGFISAIIFSFLGGPITDALGRKKTTLLFDIIGWACPVIIYLFAKEFWMFALAVIVNGAHRVTSVAYNLMVIEDSNNTQRFAAFNLINIINISAGLLTPIAGLAVKEYGIVQAQRYILLFSAICMVGMPLVRYRYHTETRIGQKILQERKRGKKKAGFSIAPHIVVLKDLVKKPTVFMIIVVYVLFNIYMTIGTHLSLYFAPYMSEVLKIDKPMISLLGMANSATMITTQVFINSYLSGQNPIKNMILALILQAIALFSLTVISGNNFIVVVLCIIVFAMGYGIFKPFVDSMLAELTEGSTRATIYSLVNTAISTFSALMGFVSGYIYDLNPRLIYITSIAILAFCMVVLMALKRLLYDEYTDVEVTDTAL